MREYGFLLTSIFQYKDSIVYSSISTILSFYEKIRVCKNQYFHIFYAVLEQVFFCQMRYLEEATTKKLTNLQDIFYQ